MRNIFKREKGTLFRGQKIWMLKNQSNVIEGEIGTAFIMNCTVQKNRGELYVSYSEQERRRQVEEKK